MSTPAVTESIQVETTGAVDLRHVTRARDRIAAALADTRQPVLFVRVRLTHLPDPAVARPAVVQVNVDLNGRLVRAEVARETMAEAIDEIHDRLRDKVHRVTSTATSSRRPH